MINAIQQTKRPGWFSEPKNLATTIIGLSLFAGLAYLFAVYVLPFLIAVTWNLVNLVIGGAILGFLLMIVTNKKFWRALNYFSQFIAEWLLNLAITTDPFMIMQNQVDVARKDRESLKVNADKLRGQQSKLTNDIADQDIKLIEPFDRGIGRTCGTNYSTIILNSSIPILVNASFFNLKFINYCR